MTTKTCWAHLVLAGLLMVSCKTVVAPPPGDIPAARPHGTDAAPAPSAPEEKAALNRLQAAAVLTDRGRILMAEGQVDPAMRLFEQALSLAPQYGPGYYFLAEAWLVKNNWSQAREFHRQATLYLEDNGAWKGRMARQARRIDRAAASGFP